MLVLVADGGGIDLCLLAGEIQVSSGSGRRTGLEGEWERPFNIELDLAGIAFGEAGFSSASCAMDIDSHGSVEYSTRYYEVVVIYEVSDRMQQGCGMTQIFATTLGLEEDLDSFPELHRRFRDLDQK